MDCSKITAKGERQVRKVLCTILAGVMTASLLAGCGGGGSDQGNSTKGSSGEAGGSQAINIGINTDVSSLDPHNHNDTASSYATRHIYSSMLF